MITEDQREITRTLIEAGHYRRRRNTQPDHRLRATCAGLPTIDQIALWDAPASEDTMGYERFAQSLKEEML